MCTVLLPPGVNPIAVKYISYIISYHITYVRGCKDVTIRQQNGLEETIIKETEQNQLTWYGHVQRMAEGRLPKIALMWMPKQKRARGRPKKN